MINECMTPFPLGRNVRKSGPERIKFSIENDRFGIEGKVT